MKEAEIRPKEIFDRYLALCRQDIDRFYGDSSAFVPVRCPACDRAASGEDGFTKLGFRYEVCGGCGTLYASPRPTPVMQDDFARKSEATAYWGSHFYRETAEARRQKIFRPRAELVASMVKDGAIPAARVFADVGAGYGLFLEEIAALGLFERVVGIEPAPQLAEICRQKGFSVVENMMEDVGTPLNADALTAFEVLEHVFDPCAFLRSCASALSDRGVLLFTTLTIDGFDLQVLWQDSNSIYPPQHINLMSLAGMKTLAQRSGLEILSITTPGKLDVDIVANALGDNPNLPVPRFVRNLLASGAENRDAFQTFLQRANLSSHVRVVARRQQNRPH